MQQNFCKACLNFVSISPVVVVKVVYLAGLSGVLLLHVLQVVYIFDSVECELLDVMVGNTYCSNLSK